MLYAYARSNFRYTINERYHLIVGVLACEAFLDRKSFSRPNLHDGAHCPILELRGSCYTSTQLPPGSSLSSGGTKLTTSERFQNGSYVLRSCLPLKSRGRARMTRTDRWANVWLDNGHCVRPPFSFRAREQAQHVHIRARVARTRARTQRCKRALAPHTHHTRTHARAYTRNHKRTHARAHAHALTCTRTHTHAHART
eukprot:112308-Pleurochrysis_carterae.AAC.1